MRNAPLTADHRPGTRALALMAGLVFALVTFLPAAPALAAGPANAAPVSEETAEAGEEKVILYATSWCPWCRKTQDLLTELDVEFALKDIEESAEAAREFQEKGGPGTGVPLIDIDGTLVKGYDEQQIRDLVAALDDN